MTQGSFSEELDNYLNAWYVYHIIGKNGADDPRPDLSTRLEEDSAFQQAATARLEELKQLQDSRCYISQVHRELLKGLLE